MINQSFLQPVLDVGYVHLTNISGPKPVLDKLNNRFHVSDRDPANCARVSFDQRETPRTPEEDYKLNSYLWQNKHTTPFEMIETWWEVKLPIVVARQFIRHRTISVNEVSRRYVTTPLEFYYPENWRGKAKNNKQGSSGVIEYSAELMNKKYNNILLDATDHYNFCISVGMCPEMARLHVPQSLYTKWVWKQNLHNLAHFINLRKDAHAQFEAREYAAAKLSLLMKVIPNLVTLMLID
jgi:thymidylate synthase (FAD)